MDGVDLVIEDVNVVDVEAGRLLPHRTVFIDADTIVEVASGEMDAVPAGARVVDGRNRYLMPGLWNMHVHLTHIGASDLEHMVDAGVTGVRDAGGVWSEIMGWRDRIRVGRVVGPRVRSSGPIIENSRWLDAVRTIPEGRALLEREPRLGVYTAAEARAAVDSVAELGVHFVKVRNAPPSEAYHALLERAAHHGLAVVSHLSPDGLRILADAPGRVGIEHIDNLPQELDELSDDERHILYERLAARQVFVTPTLLADLVRLYPGEAVAAVVRDTLGLLDPRRALLSRPLAEYWALQQTLSRYDAPADWNPILERAVDYVGELNEAGVTILAGTDLGTRLVYPGSSLHDELVLLVERAGLTPAQALRAGTLNAARFFDEANRFGTVQTGRAADLVLLDGDPLADIRNTRRIRAVVVRGELRRSDRLNGP